MNFECKRCGEMVEKRIFVCSASDYLRRPCPYNGVPTTKCKASLPYKDGACLHYHPKGRDVKPQFCDKCLDYFFGNEPQAEQGSLPKHLMPDPETGFMYE